EEAGGEGMLGRGDRLGQVQTPLSLWRVWCQPPLRRRCLDCRESAGADQRSLLLDVAAEQDMRRTGLYRIRRVGHRRRPPALLRLRRGEDRPVAVAHALQGRLQPVVVLLRDWVEL